MEDTHGALLILILARLNKSLNPYYNGRYSWSMSTTTKESVNGVVLILIIMEDTHGGVVILL